MNFGFDPNQNTVVTIVGTLGWPTDEAENDQFAEPLSAVSQLVRFAGGDQTTNDEVDGQGHEAPQGIVLRVPK